MKRKPGGSKPGGSKPGGSKPGGSMEGEEKTQEASSDVASTPRSTLFNLIRVRKFCAKESGAAIPRFKNKCRERQRGRAKTRRRSSDNSGNSVQRSRVRLFFAARTSAVRDNEAGEPKQGKVIGQQRNIPVLLPIVSGE
ncbi:hypothetical protein PUN28_019927 [Cardiocondyla obscurior]|uniref:Uncharacterized protein n=1 Tax=Cardiocondyla obscurior TaxID=286306 RepID=A0AAW2EA71_9HYME